MCVVFCRAEVFHFNEASLSVTSFMGRAFGLVAYDVVTVPSHLGSPRYRPLHVLSFLCLTFGPVMLFELMFVKSVNSVSRLTVSLWVSSCSSTIS